LEIDLKGKFEMRINKGDKIGELQLPSTSGNTFDISEVIGKKTLITFYRFATCPFCNLRLNEFSKRFDELDENFRVVAIFDSSIDFLTKNTNKHSAPFPILADENFEYFKKFQVEQSIWKFLIGSTLGSLKIFSAFARGYFPRELRSMTTVPVDILLNEDGIVEKVYYGSNTTDHLKFDEIKSFSIS
jgi:peroxiredoxin